MTSDQMIALIERDMAQAKQAMNECLERALFRSEPELFQSFRTPTPWWRWVITRSHWYLQNLWVALKGGSTNDEDQP